MSLRDLGDSRLDGSATPEPGKEWVCSLASVETDPYGSL